jgi:hypothetical protein
MDRGMASEDNVAFLNPRRPALHHRDPQVHAQKVRARTARGGPWREIREGLEVQLCAAESGRETFILCRSSDRRDKEWAIHERFEKKIVASLNKIVASCFKKKFKSRRIERPGRFIRKQRSKTPFPDGKTSQVFSPGADLGPGVAGS